ncbi:NAD+ kinase [Candidatus Poribacteria bacterium]|nr:NAD+ kinase [Candidatus Poribacteria bacterium]
MAWLFSFVSLIVIGPFLVVSADGAIKARDVIDWFSMIIGLLGGLALFLFGMEQMSSAIKAVAGDQMKNLLAKLTTNRLAGAATGAGVTAVIQSSSVTTVLVVGFITAEVMTLSQAVGVIFGSNVGTTITAQIVAFKVTKYALLMIAIGFAALFISKDEKIQHYGEILMGLGLVFFGMSVMSGAMKPLRSYEPFLNLMKNMGGNPILGILISAIFTALVQSSSATTGIVIVMASENLISLPAGIALIFGSNVGTCVTALLASLGKPIEAIRAGLAHILFNMIGVLLWLGLIPFLAKGVERIATDIPRQIANAHTIFNLVNTIIFLPFSELMVRLIIWLIPDKSNSLTESEEDVLFSGYPDSDLIAMPSIALEQVRYEMKKMAETVKDMLNIIGPSIVNADADTINSLDSNLGAIRQYHLKIERYKSQIDQLLLQILRTNLTSEQSELVVRQLNILDRLEHISQIIDSNLVTLAEEKSKMGVSFSEQGQTELNDYHQHIVEFYNFTIKAFSAQDQVAAQAVIDEKPNLVNLENVYRNTHYDRLRRNITESENTSQLHLDLIDYLHRINSQSAAIATQIISN